MRLPYLENPGKFYHHVKSSKDRRKAKLDVKNSRLEAEKHKIISELKDKKISELEEKLGSFEELRKEHKKYSDKLDKLYQKGLIDLNGDLISDEEQNQDFREEIKSENSDM